MRRRRPETAFPRFPLALGVALGVHLLVGPALLGFVSRPPKPGGPAEKKPLEARDGADQSVPAQFLTPAEVEKLIGPVPPAIAPAPPPEPPPTPSAPPTMPREERPDGQIVSIPPPPREEVPEHATRVSEYDSKVEREQVSAFNGVPQPEMRKGNTLVASSGDDPDGNTTDTREVTREKPTESRAAAPKPVPGQGEARENPTKEKGQPLPRQKAVEGRSAPESDVVADPTGEATARRNTDGPPRQARDEVIPGGAGALGGAAAPRDYRSLLPSIGPQDLARQEGNIDDIDDVEKGRGTFLNTRAYKHAWFFNRLKEEIYEHWNAVGAYRRHDPYGRVYGVRDRITVLRIELTTDGNLRDVFVLQNSGAAFLDDVAIQAVREAQPFPNPPRGLADDDGIIRITYRFTLDIETGGFRLF
jgi:TonB family protein